MITSHRDHNHFPYNAWIHFSLREDWPIFAQVSPSFSWTEMLAQRWNCHVNPGICAVLNCFYKCFTQISFSPLWLGKTLQCLLIGGEKTEEMLPSARNKLMTSKQIHWTGAEGWLFLNKNTELKNYTVSVYCNMLIMF